jgi:hypothetical protein
MRKLFFLFIVIAFAYSCKNMINDFPDFDFKAVYFPLQYPVRTLVLGEDRLDNSLDKELKFNIGAVIGGMYANNRSWHVDYVLDESLAANLVKTSTGDTLKVLPAEYYTLLPENTITIPAGSFNGKVLVQLTDDFLDDPLTIKGTYVIPLRITGTDADSILTGLPAPDVLNPDKRRASDWDANALPKDFVLFGIKYINPYHGFYFQRGIDIRFASDGVTPLDTTKYRERFVEKDRRRQITTTGRMTAQMNGVGRNINKPDALELIFLQNNDIVVDSVASSSLKAHGTGKYIPKGDEWGGEPQNVIHLQFQYEKSGFVHRVYDTLVFRNNGVVFEENIVRIINE